MTWVTKVTITCDYCGKKEEFLNLLAGQAMRHLEPKGWKHYPQTGKHYCSRTCSANHRPNLNEPWEPIRTT